MLRVMTPRGFFSAASASACLITPCSTSTFSTRSRRAFTRSRMPPRVVVRRPAHDRHQQRDLRVDPAPPSGLPK